MVNLDIAKVALGAIVVPWWNRRAFCRSLVIPFLLLLVLAALQSVAIRYFIPWLLRFTWLLEIFYGLVLVLFAVTCHRLVLLEPQSDVVPLVPKWSRRETRFALRMLGFVLVWLVSIPCIVLLCALIASELPSLEQEAKRWSIDLLLIGQLPIFYLFVRLCLIFPATAIDRKVNLKWAWATSNDCGWRLFFVVAIFPWMIVQAMDFLYRDHPSVIETIGLSALRHVVLVIQITALSLSYRELTRNPSLDVNDGEQR